MSNLLYILSQNQDKQAKLRHEIREKLPLKTSELQSKSLKNIPYLRACMKESARIMPITNQNMRRLPEDMELAGYLIPKGVRIY